MMHPTDQVWAFIAYGAMVVAAIGFSVIAVTLPSILGPRKTHNAIKDSAYECGLPATPAAPPRFSVKFYVVAMLFILFDIEVVFLVAWGVLYRKLVKPEAAGGLGWAALGIAVIFLLILEVGHIYAWRTGALDWASWRSRPQKGPHT
jgi:NADH-quinone oxidoreductase subunit A